MKAMKAMKAAMKAMKAMRVSKIAKGKMSKALVLRGSKVKTVGGLTAKDLSKNKYGRVVSKKKSALGKANPWIIAVKKARAALKITGFSAIKKGSPLYIKAKEFMKKGACCDFCEQALEQTSSSVVSIPAVALMSLIVGSGVSFGLLRFRRGASNAGSEPLLP